MKDKKKEKHATSTTFLPKKKILSSKLLQAIIDGKKIILVIG